MATAREFVIFTLALFFLHLSAAAHYAPCSEGYFLYVSGKNLSHCKKLPTLAAEFAWRFNEEGNGSLLEIVFGAKLPADVGWLAWGVNPDEWPHMVGTRAIIGIKDPNGTTTCNTYNITWETKLHCGLRPSPIDVEVRERSFLYLSSVKYYMLHATLVLPSSVYNTSRLNHVWQVGYLAEGLEPKMHQTTLQNVDSTETIDLTSMEGKHVGVHRHHFRMVHGILNIVGWGTFLPAGVVVARYFKHPLEFKRWWFRLHISCQIVGYILGTAGWIIGLWLGHASRYYTFRKHRIFAIFIFAFATLQMFALRLKPDTRDEYRKYWNMYHHALGYALLAVIATNIFEGIAILKPDHRTWRGVYIAILGTFALLVIALEIYNWKRFLADRKKLNKDGKPAATGDKSQNTTQTSVVPSLHN